MAKMPHQSFKLDFKCGGTSEKSFPLKNNLKFDTLFIVLRYEGNINSVTFSHQWHSKSDMIINQFDNISLHLSRL